MRRLVPRAATGASTLLAPAAVALIAVALAAVALAAGPAAAAGSPPATPLPASSVEIVRDITYAEVGGTQLTLDAYVPDTDQVGRPAVVLIHGGAWGTGESDDLDREGRLLARQGWVAFSVNYRLADEAPKPWPDELTDVQRATRWVAANAVDYGADGERLVAMGFSAGGHLAAMLAVVGTAVDGTGRRIDDPNPAVRVKAVAAWSPPTRLAGLVSDDSGNPPDCEGNKRCQSFWRLPLVENFVGCLPEACPESYDQASLTERIGPGTAPIWFANSTNEITGLPQATALSEALTDGGIEHRFEQYDGSAHADEYRTKAWNPMMEWLAAQIGVAPPPPISFSGQRNILLSPVVVVSVIVGLALLIALLAVALRDDEGAL